MDNRRYSRDDGGSLRWVLKREITIRNFRTRDLKMGKTELHYACCENDEAWLVRACIAFNDDDINAPSIVGSTPLHCACEFGQVDVVELLLESGAESSLCHKNSTGKIPIDDVIRCGKFDVVKLLHISCSRQEDGTGEPGRNFFDSSSKSEPRTRHAYSRGNWAGHRPLS